MNGSTNKMRFLAKRNCVRRVDLRGLHGLVSSTRRSSLLGMARLRKRRYGRNGAYSRGISRGEATKRLPVPPTCSLAGKREYQSSCNGGSFSALCYTSFYLKGEAQPEYNLVLVKSGANVRVKCRQVRPTLTHACPRELPSVSRPREHSS